MSNIFIYKKILSRVYIYSLNAKILCHYYKSLRSTPSSFMTCQFSRGKVYFFASHRDILYSNQRSLSCEIWKVFKYERIRTFFQFFIRTPNLEAIPTRLRFKALSSPVKLFLVQEFESFVRRPSLPLSNRIPSAGSRTTKELARWL